MNHDIYTNQDLQEILCLGLRFHCPPPKLITLCRNKLLFKSYVMFKLGGAQCEHCGIEFVGGTSSCRTHYLKHTPVNSHLATNNQPGTTKLPPSW